MMNTSMWDALYTGMFISLSLMSVCLCLNLSRVSGVCVGVCTYVHVCVYMCVLICVPAICVYELQERGVQDKYDI